MNTSAIAVVVNGEPRELPFEQSVTAMLEHLQIPADRVAVELNKVLIRKRNWAATWVTSGSRVEIVEFVGGG